MIISSTSDIQGRSVERYLGLVFGEVVLGTSFFADVTAGWTDLFGRSSGDQAARGGDYYRTKIGRGTFDVSHGTVAVLNNAFTRDFEQYEGMPVRNFIDDVVKAGE